MDLPSPTKKTKKMKKSIQKTSKSTQKHFNPSIFGFGVDNFILDAPFLVGYALVTPVWLLSTLAAKGARVDVTVSTFSLLFVH